MNTLAPHGQATERVVGHGAAAFEQVRLRRDALEASGIDGLIVPVRVALQSHDSVVVAEPVSGGVTLQNVLASRGSLSAGECVWWAAQVAQLLASLHKVGIAHGALSADAVVIDGERVRLGCLVDGAPGASGPDDVAALGSLLAQCVRPDEAARVLAWAEPMQHERSDARPSAAMVARAIASCAPAQPIDIPARDVVGSLRRRASVGHDVERLRDGWWWRLRVVARRRRRVALIGAGGLAVLGIAMGALMLGSSVGGGGDTSAGASVPSEAVAEVAPADAAVQLTRDRFSAMATGDAAALVALTVPGSVAYEDAVAAADLLTEGRLAFDTTHGVPMPADVATHVEAYDDSDGTVPREAVVIVDYTSPAYGVTLDGVRTDVPSEYVRVRMKLTWVDGEGWRVADVGQAELVDVESATY